MASGPVVVHCAAAKVPRFGLRLSGDSIDLVERPRGGLSLILADGQGSGEAAKRVSGPVVARTAALLAEGGRDGSAARMAHDTLFALRGGRVSSTLVILSADVAADALVVTRSGDSPVYVRLSSEEGWPARVERLDQELPPLGVGRFTRPAVHVFPLRAGTILLGFSDGVVQVDRERGEQVIADEVAERLARAAADGVADLVDDVLAHAAAASGGRPRDDMTVLAMGLTALAERRETSVRLSLEMAVHA